MTHSELLTASCRVALAAFLHDLGKFAERARISEADEEDGDGNSRKDINKQLVCPHFNGRYSHIHAAYTAISFDLIDRYFPKIVGDDMRPFAPWRDRNADDSLINAAAKHHRPDTYLQWIIATADRVASGFEREEFEEYNKAEDQTREKKNHYTARQFTLLEQIRLNSTGDDLHEVVPDHRYPLRPLSPLSIFPREAKGYETDDNAKAQEEYHRLWEQFIHGLDKIPAQHREQLPLWLDHFDSLWLTFTHAIPAATAFNVKPEVSLYDHSKTAAALATALWRYHAERMDDPEQTRSAMSARADWKESKFLLIQGDFFGIQDFIFASGDGTQKRAAKLLRGRSFYVSLLTECAALKVLDKLALPATSQVTNAAGKFLIVAPNTEATVSALVSVQRELNEWFLQYTYGQAGVGLAWLPASCDDFLKQRGKESPFRNLVKRLFEQLEAVKLQRFSLCTANAEQATFDGFLDQFDNTKGVCAIDGRSPASVPLSGPEAGPATWVSPLARDQVNTGTYLVAFSRIVISRNPLNHNALLLPIFGYHINFTKAEAETGKFGAEAVNGNLVRMWDFAVPADAEAALWNGYARRQINGYVPRFGDVNEWDLDRYEGLEVTEAFEKHPGEIKTLNHLARDAKWKDEHDRWVGVEALMTLKGDVDNLGAIFQSGIKKPTFAKMASLSRQINAFFTVYLPWLCAKDYPNTYTVFAGGDDFFLIGPWRSVLRLAIRMHTEFQRYVVNDQIHFSTGLSMVKPGLPIRHLARMAEHALEEAKGYNPSRELPAPKNAVSCFGTVVGWNQFIKLMEREEALKRLAEELDLSTGYLYSLLNLTDMASEVERDPKNALWHSRFAYRTRRLLESRKKLDETRRRRLQQELAHEIAELGIGTHGKAYKIALFTHLYQQRD